MNQQSQNLIVRLSYRSSSGTDIYQFEDDVLILSMSADTSIFNSEIYNLYMEMMDFKLSWLKLEKQY